MIECSTAPNDCSCHDSIKTAKEDSTRHQGGGEFRLVPGLFTQTSY